GYGANHVRYVFGMSTGALEYSHHNFIELLVGIGLIVRLTYYFGYLYILKRSFIKNDNLLAFAFVLILTVSIIDVGLVSYNSFYVQFLICILFSSVGLSNRTFKNNEKGNAT